MPLALNMLDSEVFGPPLRKALKEGRERGLQEGRETGLWEGRTEEARRILRLQIEKRFGTAPDWAGERISLLSREDAESLMLAIFEATSLESLFGPLR